MWSGRSLPCSKVPSASCYEALGVKPQSEERVTVHCLDIIRMVISPCSFPIPLHRL